MNTAAVAKQLGVTKSIRKQAGDTHNFHNLCFTINEKYVFTVLESAQAVLVVLIVDPRYPMGSKVPWRCQIDTLNQWPTIH